jgi:hypothetical protein
MGSCMRWQVSHAAVQGALHDQGFWQRVSAKLGMAVCSCHTVLGYYKYMQDHPCSCGRASPPIMAYRSDANQRDRARVQLQLHAVVGVKRWHFAFSEVIGNHLQ